VLLKQEQRQTLSQRIDPKLIMANAILQQSSLELVQQIEAELLENPALDVIEEIGCAGDCVDPLACPHCSQRILPQRPEIEDLSPIEPEPESVLFDGGPDPDLEADLVGNIEAELTLQDHLCNQLRAAVDESDYEVGEYIIQNLDEGGFLDSTTLQMAIDLDVEPERIQRLLSVIQTFDPPGIAASDLRECMLIQLRFLREEGQGNPLAEKVVRSFFDEMVSHRFTRIARVLGVTVAKVKAAVDFVRAKLNPYPASQFRPPWASKAASTRSSIKPDVIIRRTQLGYEVDVTGTDGYLLGVSPTYRQAYDKIKSGNGRVTTEEKQHVTEYVERAELFIRNIQQRRRTLKQITRAIVDKQMGFLETGKRTYLRSLTRTTIAEELKIHESTVSRATAKKYVQLPNQEVVPFEFFFNPSLSIKTAIEEIIATENPLNPLSDRRIVEMLRERGMDVARRTVVKYRDAQKLLSSNHRRR
jgi:RNA polymerase sigma-54 factor